jgi:rhodanese-related sulfurtransferase
MLKNFHILTITLILLLPALGHSDTVKGRIKYISHKANTIQIDVKNKKPVVVSFDNKTTYHNANGIKDLNPPDLIKVEFTPGQAASKISKVTFGLPAGVEIDRKELLAILQGKRGKYTLGDSRPPKKVMAGHIPSARAIFPENKEAFIKALPTDKNQLLVFYCGGPTCPFTGQSVKLAMDNGYTNVKGYQAGLPAWKRSKMVVHSEPQWLSKNLAQHVVILDVRSPEMSSSEHIKGAVSMPAPTLVNMTRQFVASKTIPKLAGVSDLRAPIVIYSNSHTDRDALLAFKQLRSWGYSNTSILNGGLKQWKSASLPTATGNTANAIVYVKRLPKGAIKPDEFIQLAQAEGTVLIDVRSDKEVSAGSIKGSRHIALNNLAQSLPSLDKNKEILVYCANGIRAEMAYETLTEHGFKTRFLNETPEFDGKGGFSL